MKLSDHLTIALDTLEKSIPSPDVDPEGHATKSAAYDAVLAHIGELQTQEAE